MTPGFIQPLTTALLIEKLKYIIARCGPISAYGGRLLMLCLGIGSIPRASSSCAAASRTGRDLGGQEAGLRQLRAMDHRKSQRRWVYWIGSRERI